MTYYKKYLNFLLNKNRLRWGYLIFFVTSKCNSKCKHCFYWKSLNSGLNELSLSEIEEISRKSGRIQVLLLSGGEPFLREDLFELISIFIKNNSVKVVSIPTNALLKNKIIEITKRLSEEFPRVLFSINPSIDDLEEKNDEVRGVEGGFQKSIETLKELIKLKEKCKNVEVVVNTTISNFNYKDIEEIINYFKKFNITYHNFELLRGKPKEKSMNLPSLKEIKDLHRKILELREFYIMRQKNEGIFNNFFEKLSVLGITKYTHFLKEQVLESKGLPFQCSAGKNILVLEPEGSIRLCELLPSVGNLRDYNYDIEKLLKNEEVKKIRNIIKDCNCTHVCFLNMSIAKDKKSLIKIPYYFLK